MDLGLLIKKMFSRSGRENEDCLHLSFKTACNNQNVHWLQVCDQPHPLHVKNMVRQVIEGKFDDACAGLKQLYDLGYSPTDIITTLFRIIKNYDMPEYLKLEFMKVCHDANAYFTFISWVIPGFLILCASSFNLVRTLLLFASPNIPFC